MLHLLHTPRFAPLFVTQFLGALNDNLFKSALVAALTFRLIEVADLDLLVNAATALLVLPFFLFSAFAGELADSVDKARLSRALKSFELLSMALAAWAFVQGSVVGLFAALALMGTQSAFFGPIKYAILPQHLTRDELVAGNALVETATFIAIVVGTVIGTLIVGLDLAAVGGVLIALAIAGRVAASKIPAAPPEAGARLRLRGSMGRTLRALRTRSLRSAVLAISAFWLAGAVLLAQLPAVASALGGKWTLALSLAAFSLGIGFGSFVAERLSKRLGAMTLGTLAPAALAMSVAMVGVALSQTFALLALALFLTGAAGGVFIVPLYARMQADARPDERARVIAANNLINALFMVLGTAYAVVRLTLMNASARDVIAEMGAFVLLVAVVTFMRTARSAVQWMIRGLIRVLYRVKVSGAEQVPSSGPVIVYANHESFVDAFVVGAFIERPARFVMDHRMAKMPILRHFFDFARVIPIASHREDPELLQRAFDEMEQTLRNGEVLVIFPEGRCTRDGEMGMFRRGVQRLVARLDASVPLVPAHLQGLWGGFFSYAGGPPMKRLPRRFRARVRLAFGAPGNDPSPDALRAEVCALAPSTPSRPASRAAASVRRALTVVAALMASSPALSSADTPTGAAAEESVDASRGESQRGPWERIVDSRRGLLYGISFGFQGQEGLRLDEALPNVAVGVEVAYIRLFESYTFLGVFTDVRLSQAAQGFDVAAGIRAGWTAVSFDVGAYGRVGVHSSFGVRARGCASALVFAACGGVVHTGEGSFGEVTVLFKQNAL
ncbi:MAG: MFS transporter [Myxococcota bacterium]